ncbi:MAG: DUF1737 domain-containing protein [Thermoleophilia bacterium]|nr:DUF1737 domain-containing protein [Thermoleophilia bacterium]
MSSSETERLPYRLLTGDTTRAFCERISGALRDGYVLYGDPIMTFDGERVVTAQAVVLPERHPTNEAE